MKKLISAAAAIALLSATGAMAQSGTSTSNTPGDPTSVKEGQANCPAGTTANNCQGRNDGGAGSGNNSGASGSGGSSGGGSGGSGGGSGGSGGGAGGGGAGGGGGGSGGGGGGGG